MTSSILAVIGILGALGGFDHDLEQFAHHQYAECPADPAITPDRDHEAGGSAQFPDPGDVSHADHRLWADRAAAGGAAWRASQAMALAWFVANLDGGRVAGFPDHPAGRPDPGADGISDPIGRRFFPCQQRGEGQRPARHQQLPPAQPGIQKEAHPAQPEWFCLDFPPDPALLSQHLPQARAACS